MDYITKTNDYLLKLEASFDEKKVIPWMSKYWWLSFVFSAIYLALVLGGHRFMKTRKPFDLRRPLCMWSTALCVFSFFALFRIKYIAFRMIYVGGIRHALCDPVAYIGMNGGGLWAFLFPFSKLPELGDTAFIVLRKKKLSFLHTYHHITVFIYCWYSYAYPISTGIWFGMVNYVVHGIMYAYYAYTASGRVLPRKIAKCITIIQLSQMFCGIFINYIGITSLLANKTCGTNWTSISIAVLMYVSYAILFGNFFYHAYIKRKPQAAMMPVSKSTEKVTSNISTNGDYSFSSIPNGFQPVTSNGVHRRKGM